MDCTGLGIVGAGLFDLYCSVPLGPILYRYLHGSRDIYTVATAGGARASKRFLNFCFPNRPDRLDLFYRVIHSYHSGSLLVFSQKRHLYS